MTLGHFNTFNFDDAYCTTAVSLSSTCHSGQRLGGQWKNPKPLAGTLPTFFANRLPEDKLLQAMGNYRAGNVRAGNDLDLLAALDADLPSEFHTLSEGKVLFIKRLDHGAGGVRIHIEGLAQVFGVYPSRKYEGSHIMTLLRP